VKQKKHEQFFFLFSKTSLPSNYQPTQLYKEQSTKQKNKQFFFVQEKQKEVPQVVAPNRSTK
jgi:hypothetical protein